MSQDVARRGTVGASLAGALMVMAGLFGILQGISGVAKSGFFTPPSNYWVSTGSSGWGWWHIIVSVVVLAAGLGIFAGVAAARAIGIVVVGLQALTNFLFIPVQPAWAIVLIAIDLWVIHSLFVNRGDIL